MFPSMEATHTTHSGTTLETLIRQIVSQVVDRIDIHQLRERKFAYTAAEVAELVGFTNELAVMREVQSHKLVGSKVRGKWRFTEEQIREYLRDNEVAV